MFEKIIMDLRALSQILHITIVNIHIQYDDILVYSMKKYFYFIL